MKKSELISVVIPAYNRENTIVDCIQSVLNQTYNNLEVIVVDDCSSDDTANIVDSFKDPRVKDCIRLPQNRGACYARNHGASLARGEIIAFQDSDDIWDSEKLEKQLRFMNAGDYDMVFCGMRRINRFMKKEWYFPLYDFNEKGDIQKQILYENCVGTQCILIKKSAFNKVRFDDSIKKYQDWDFAIRAAAQLKIGYLKESLVIAEVQENSVSRSTSKYEALFTLYKKYEQIIRNDPALDASFLYRLGDNMRNTDTRRASTLYSESLKLRFGFKVFIKWLLCKSLSKIKRG